MARMHNPPHPGEVVLRDINIDDWFFGVASVSADGYESPVEFPGPAGAFVASPASTEGH